MLQNEVIHNLETSKKKTLVIESGTNWLDNIFYNNDESGMSLLNMMGKPLILYNIEKLLLLKYDIDHIILPDYFSKVSDIVQERFPLIQIIESKDDKKISSDSIKISTNSVITKPKGTNAYVTQKMVYPWDVLKTMHDVLNTDVTTQVISKNSSIANSAIVKGPCIIEDDVYVDDFSKIIGPIYVGKNAKIGTGSLVRHSMLGDNTAIGFSCEIARSFFMGDTRIAHLDVILDSIIGQNCWLGGYVGTTNVLLNQKIIRYKLDNVLVSTGLDNFGSVIGHDCAIGAGTILLPGRFVPPHSTIQAGTVISK